MTRTYPEAEGSRRRTAVMAGSFDPFTVGHLSVLLRGLNIFDRIIIMIGRNADKSEAAMRADRRAEELTATLEPLGDAVEVTTCEGLVAVAAREAGACALLRGVRSVADYEYERNMADVNRLLAGIDTVMLFAEPQQAALSSSLVRELASYGYDTSRFTPTRSMVERLTQKPKKK